MKLVHSLLAKVTGKNLQSTPKDVIIDQMNEPRPLPMGTGEFEEWSNRIISGALLPTRHLYKADEENLAGLGEDLANKLRNDAASALLIFHESQKFALANMLMHLGPTESHKPDAFFIHSLRKFAVNQVADSVRKELHEAAKARTEAEEAAKKAQSEDATS